MMERVTAVHVIVTTVADYPTRREPHRQAHIDHLLRLRALRRFVGGGPAPDGRTAELFYRVERPEEVDRLITEDPYHRGGVWAGYAPRLFTEFVEPWDEAPPVVLDGSRRLTVVEGPVADPDLARFALIELRGQGRLVFGGTFSGGETLAVLRASDPAEGLAWLGETGLWTSTGLQARPLLHVL
jgi:uncharacterized protein YciI